MKKNLELLPPNNAYEILQERRRLIANYLNFKKKNISAPTEGKLRGVKHGNKFQFYLITSKEKPNGTYIRKKDMYLAKRIAQKEYDQEVVALLSKQLTAIDKLLPYFSPDKLSFLYNKLSPARQTIVSPVTLPDQDYIKQWLSQTFPEKTAFAESKTHITSFGLPVRSKSEELIAETLHRNNIPFFYEYPFETTDQGIFYPDFYCLNISTRQTFYWEHFGLMDDPDYAISTVKKLFAFQQKGYFPGKNLIITMESSQNPINTRQIQKVIDAYF